MILWKYIKKSMLRNPRQIICEETASMTYEDVVVFSELFAKRLLSEKCCAIMCNNEMAAALALLACFAADVAAVPLSLRYGKDQCNKILELISPTAIITDTNGELEVVRLADSKYKVPKERPALIMCTSGTMGTPKGIMLSGGGLFRNAFDISSYLESDENDYILISRPLYHSGVLTGEFLVSLINGVKIRFYSKQFNPYEISKIISDEGITVYGGTPTTISMLARCKRGGNSLKYISISGECMGESIATKISNAFPNVKIYHGYGLTEASPRVSYLPPEFFNNYGECVGIPLKSVLIKIVKSNGTIAKTGESGMLWVSGKSLMLGYYNNSKLTKKVLKDGWLCTGDIAYITEQGFLKILGRQDNMIIRAGVNIYPQEIENVLKTDKRVSEILVYGIKKQNHGQEIGMKIVGDFNDVNEVRSLCVKRLPKHQVPSSIQLVNKLPRTISGKIMRGEKNDRT